MIKSELMSLLFVMNASFPVSIHKKWRCTDIYFRDIYLEDCSIIDILEGNHYYGMICCGLL